MRMMAGKKGIRFAAVAVLVCFVLFSVGTSVFAVAHESHDCAGFQCETCAQLQHLRQLVRQILVATACLLTGGLLAPVAGCLLRCNAKGHYATLVRLKVQQNK